jgi:hypothetical protein
MFFVILMTKNKGVFNVNLVSAFFWSLFLIVFAGNLFSMIHQKDIELTDYFVTILRYLSYFVLAMLLLLVTKKKSDLQFWVKAFLVCYFLSLILIILDSFKVPFVEPVFKVITFESYNTLDIYFRAYGAYLSPISAGIFIMNVLVVLLTYLFFNEKKESRWNVFYIVLIITASIVCLIMTASRTAILGFLVLLLLLVWESKRKWSILFFGVLVGAVIYQSGLIDVYIENIIMRNEKESATSTNILEGSGRLDTLKNSIRLFFDYRFFLTGVGPSEYNKGDGVYSLAHNGFASVLFCYGIIGFIVFYRFIKKMYLLSVKQNNYVKNVFRIFMIVNLVTFLSSDGPVTHFWLVSFVIFVSYIYLISNDEKEMNQNFATK